MVSMVKTGIKLCAACRQFHFFSRPTSGRFHNFMPVFTHETISQFHFLRQQSRKKSPVSNTFHVKLCHNKKSNKWGLQLKPRILHKTGYKTSCSLGFDSTLDNFLFEPVFTLSHKDVKMLVRKSENVNLFSQFHTKKWKCGWVSSMKFESFKEKWKCSLLLWFQNDAWICMKNFSSSVILKLVEKVTFDNMS